MKITPQYISTFETKVQTRIQNAWNRVLKNLFWEKFMERRQSEAGKDIHFWLLETAGIYKEGQGGNKRYDDIVAMSNEIVNENAGAGLELTKNELEDNQMNRPNMGGMPALDYAASWGKQVGANGAYWPQKLLFDLIANGKTTNGYDGVPFFSASHPVNPYKSGGAVYPNLITAKPIGGATPIATAVANFASAVAIVESIIQPNGYKRMLEVKYAMGGPDLKKPLYEVLDTKNFGGAAGTMENVVSRYGIEPVIAKELPSDGTGTGENGVYYFFCEPVEDDGAPFIFSDREAFTLNSYVPESQAQLGLRKKFEWMFDGRNAGQYGHPYLCFRVEPT